MYIVEFKVKKTNRTGKYMFECLDAARNEESRLKKDKGLKSVKLQKINS